MLYSTLLCKKIARAPGVQKRFMLTKLRGGGNRIDPKIHFDLQVKSIKNKNTVGDSIHPYRGESLVDRSNIKRYPQKRKVKIAQHL